MDIERLRVRILQKYKDKLGRFRKIIVLAPPIPPYGGVSVHVAELAANVEGLEVDRVYPFYKRNIRRSLVEFANMLRTTRRAGAVYDNSPTWLFPALGLALLTLLKLVNPKIHYILHIHSGKFVSLRSSFLLRLFLLLVSEIWVVSEAQASKVREILGFNKAQIMEPLFRRVDHKSADLNIDRRIKEFLLTHEPIILSVGAFTPTYSFLIILDAFPRILSKYPKAGLILVGGSLPIDSRYYSKVIEKAQSANLRDNVLILMDRDATPLYLSADVFIRATKYDGYPISMLEAYSAGCRVLASDSVPRPNWAVTFHLDPDSLAEAAIKEIDRLKTKRKK